MQQLQRKARQFESREGKATINSHSSNNHVTAPQVTYTIHNSADPRVFHALLAAIDDFAEQYFHLPDEVIMNSIRRLEMGMDYRETVYHGAIPIRVRSPHDCSLLEWRVRSLPYEQIVCFAIHP